MVPCLIREDTVMDEVDGQVRTYCSETCHWTDKVAFRPEYEGRPTRRWAASPAARVETLYHGQGISREIIEDLGYVPRRRQHAVPQPHLNLDPKKMWTLDESGDHALQPTSRSRDVPEERETPLPRPSAAAARHAGGAAYQATGSRRRAAPPSRPPWARPHRPVRAVGNRYRGERGRRRSSAPVLPSGHHAQCTAATEGQCSACKSFLLDGDVDLDRYSTFALPDFEEAEGWTLLCRAHAYSDLEVELINYDEEVLHGGTPPRTSHARDGGRAADHDIRGSASASRTTSRSSSSPASTSTSRSPAHEDEHRSFSMANTRADGELEFMIKRYRGGRFSGCSATTASSRRRAEVTGPYGVFTLRASSPAPAVFIGGGAGMAPSSRSCAP
jgi:ferredoxin